MANRYDDIERRYEQGREDYGWDRYERERDRPYSKRYGNEGFGREQGYRGGEGYQGGEGFRESGRGYRGGEGYQGGEGFRESGRGYRGGEGFRGEGGWGGYERESEYGRGPTSSSRGWGRGQSGWDEEYSGQRSGERGFRGEGAFSAEGEYPRRGGVGTQSQYGRGEYGKQGGESGSSGFSSGFGGGMGNYSSGQGRSYGSYGGGAGMETYGRHTGRGPRGYQRSDERIREDVNERLTQHPEIDATEIEVMVANGEVTLTGTVDDRQAKRMAEDVAESVSGVKDVHNQVRVKQQQQHEQGSGKSHEQGSNMSSSSSGSTSKQSSSSTTKHS